VGCLVLPPHSKRVPGLNSDWGSLHVLPVHAWVLSGYFVGLTGLGEYVKWMDVFKQMVKLN